MMEGISWSCQDEFFTQEECQIPLLPVQIFEGFLLVILASLLVAMSLMMRRRFFMRAPPVAIILIWMMGHVLLTSGRGVLNLLGIYSEHSLWANLLVNGSAASATGVVTFFMYLELQIIVQGSLGHQSMTLAKGIMISIAILQALVFLTLPILFHLLDAPHLLYLGFWIPATLANLVAITYFCILGFTIYGKLKRSSLPVAQRISKRLLIFLMICGSLGGVSGISGLTAILWRDMGWILIRVCWLSVGSFVFMMFFSLTREAKRREGSRERRSTRATKDVSPRISDDCA